jgi:transporter family-2 protein
MDLLAIPFLLSVGALLALQAGANVQLAAALGNATAASALQLSIGAALLITAAALAGTLGAADELGDVRAWHLVGGLGSALYITAGILLFPRLGAVVTVGLFVTGQMLASLVLDGAGWLGLEPQRRADDRPHDRRPAARVGVRGPPRTAPPAEAADHGHPAGGGGDAARRSGAQRVRTPTRPGKRASRSSPRSEIQRVVPSARVRVTPASRSSRRW